ncbi:MAG TPA: UDP-2,3-diacylglucosamine diphosphatase LpxI, partial [Xanthobacteraceae bacterium]|nr:UDP-2,3-diacylglucosamine diphosphatase LpxI [Xanthobacteraceae bacterium]
GIKGWADAAVIARYAHHWIAIGQAGRFFRLARAEDCRDVVFIGTVLRPPITQLRLDWQTIRAMPGLIRAYRGGDDKLISGVARIAERGGLRVVGVKDVAPEVLVPQGVLGRHRPSDRDRADIARALEVIAALGPFDVGQAAVVADNNVLGVEAAEGTDNLLNRIAELRRIGRVTSAPGIGVLVKAPKPGQDRRLDLPSIGPRTVENVARAGLAGLAVTAGSTMIAEPDAVTAAADREGIFLVGVREDAAQ